MCNSGFSTFEWIPKSVPESSESEAEKFEAIGNVSEETTLIPVMSAFVPLVLIIVGILAYFIVDRKRKAARLAAVRIFSLK